MVKQDQRGAAASLLISLILFIILFIAALGFGIYSYSKMLDYKNNVDQKISVAVSAAKIEQTKVDNNNFAISSLSPLTTYYGPSQYGSIVVNYPKTWSAYVDDSDSQSALVDGYFNPGHVPSLTNQASTFALRVQVLNQSYSQSIQQYNGQNTQNKVTATAYSLPKVPKTVGVELSGDLTGGQNPVNTTMVVLPDRNYTIEIWTQGTVYLSDFNNYILPNFSFSP